MTMQWWACGLMALAASLAMHALRLRAPLGADEAYLWYGVQQLRRGRVPHRDFKAYEPGRYLWSALLSGVSGPGLRGLRLSTHLFFALGLAAALVVLRDLGLGWALLACAAATLALWSHPQHKQFEHGGILFAWAVATHGLLAPTPANLALAGATAGLALLFGFNLLLYFGAAFAGAFALAWIAGWIAPDASAFAAIAAGALAGVAPFGLMLLSPELARRFNERRVAGVVARGSANLALPLPWPWRPVPRQFHTLDAARQRSFQLLFLALFLAPVAALAFAFAGPASPPVARGLVAAALLGLVTSHHAASRADAAHITQALGPACVLAILLLAGAAPFAGLVLVAASCWLAWPLHAQGARGPQASAFETRVVGGLRIDVLAPQARLLDAAHALCAAHPGDRAGLLALPHYPVLYAALSRDSPVYDTFCVYPGTDGAQQEMIDAIDRARPFAALVCDAPFDGRDDLRFSRTHPRVWAHLCARMPRVARPELGKEVFLFGAPVPAAAGAAQVAMPLA